MPVTIVEDIYGSTHTLGYASSQGEKVIRRHYVEGITGNHPLEEAITAVTDPVSGVINFNTRFPLLSGVGMTRQNVTAKQIGVGRFIVEEVYAWNSSSWGNFETNTLAEYRTGYEATQCYTVGAVQSHGLPGTIAQGAQWKDLPDETRLDPGPQPYSFMRPVVRIGVPFKSKSNPLTSGIYGLIGKLNANNVTIPAVNLPGGGGQITFSQYQIRFDGIEMSTRTNSGFPFQGTYMYTASRSFAEQRIRWNTNKWEVTVVAANVAYDTANF